MPTTLRHRSRASAGRTPRATVPPRDPIAPAPVAWGRLLATAGVMMAALAVTSGRYGYHYDELYFIQAGAHPAWGYPDQPLLTPLLARAMDLLAPGSLLVLRAPSILACGMTTVTTGLLARETGGGRRAQGIAAACWAAAAVCLVTGHLLSTTTYDVCATAIVSLLIARVLRTRDGRWWIPAGLVLGIGLLNKVQVGLVMIAVLIGLIALEPRSVLRSRWLVAGAALAILGALPYTLWQLTHGLPQEQLARAIAASGYEGGRTGFIPFQLVLIGPLLTPVWTAGLLRVCRDPTVRALRCFAFAYPVLMAAFILEGGRAYYMAGVYPILLGAGAVSVDRWIGRSRWPVRRWLLVLAVTLTGAANAVIGLDVLPVRDLQGSIVEALDPEAGQTVGWPRFTRTVATVYRTLPAEVRSRTVIFTYGYGEAGAIAHFGPALGLPYPYSGHNAWWLWGPPPNRDTEALLVGLDRRQATSHFTDCRIAGGINDAIGLDNAEQGELLWVCTRERRPWSQLWPSLRHYN